MIEQDNDTLVAEGWYKEHKMERIGVNATPLESASLALFSLPHIAKEYLLGVTIKIIHRLPWGYWEGLVYSVEKKRIKFAARLNFVSRKDENLTLSLALWLILTLSLVSFFEFCVYISYQNYRQTSTKESLNRDKMQRILFILLWLYL